MSSEGGAPGEFGLFWPSLPRIAREGASVVRMITVPLDGLRPAPRVPAFRAPVLLIPGYMAGDWTMGRLERRLHARGHPTMRARIGLNVGCTIDLVDRLEERIEELSARRERRVAIVGWSRGGLLGKLLTLRRPELVAGLITLASPTVQPLAVSRIVNLHVRMLTRLHSVGARMVLGGDCVDGSCAARVRDELERSFPAGVPFTALYSRNDGVVDWRACCDGDAECIEVHATHMQMGANVRVIELVARRLAMLDDRQAPLQAASSA